MEKYQLIISILNIIAIIITPFATLYVSSLLQDKKNKHFEKINVLKTLMVQRLMMPKNIDYVYTLNLIDVIFVDNLSVRKAYKNLYDIYSTNLDLSDAKNANKFYDMLKEAETKLIEEIIKDVGYKDKITWDSIQKPYIPKWIMDENEAKAKIINAQLNIASLFNNEKK